ncbi:MAG: hypothetical protein Ct9H90mP25_1860 [Gammaproteobacteria bacterium]|nr:MAG: hypothetical protein Ct9H90mP25_1860 [Gammaproteobacteria bacterium]
MMFLQYAVWGIWLPVLATYLQSPIVEGGLGFTSGQVGWIIGIAASLGAVSAPFIAGQFAESLLLYGEISFSSPSFWWCCKVCSLVPDIILCVVSSVNFVQRLVHAHAVVNKFHGFRAPQKY